MRVQDADFSRREIAVRQGKDRRTMLPMMVVEALRGGWPRHVVCTTAPRHTLRHSFAMHLLETGSARVAAGKDRGQAHGLPRSCASRARRSGYPWAARKASRAAWVVCAMISSLWAMDTNPASNALGARYTPRSRMAWKNRLNIATSQAVAWA